MELKRLHKHPLKVIVTAESFYKQVIKARYAIGTTVNKYELVVNIQACLWWQQFKGQTKKNKSDYTIHVGLLTCDLGLSFLQNTLSSSFSFLFCQLSIFSPNYFAIQYL